MAKKRISGFIVEIGGDTSKLGKALSEVDTKSKNLQNELRGVNSLLKLDPTNVELLKQKEELLTQSISETEKKLDILNQTMKKIDSGEVEVSEEQFRDLKREIEATKIKLNSYKGDLDGLKKSTSDFADETEEAKKTTSEFASETKKADLSDFKKEIDDVKTSASNLKDEIKNTASEVAVSVAAIGTAAIGAVTTANEETKAMNSLQAQTGLTTQELEKYGGVIKSIYQNNFGESQEDIANTIAKIKQFTGETDPSKIQAMAENLYTMQDTFENFDIDETLRGVNGLMTNVNLTAEEAFDFLVTGTQRGLNYSGELADNIAEYSSLCLSNSTFVGSCFKRY